MPKSHRYTYMVVVKHKCGREKKMRVSMMAVVATDEQQTQKRIIHGRVVFNNKIESLFTANVFWFETISK